MPSPCPRPLKIHSSILKPRIFSRIRLCLSVSMSWRYHISFFSKLPLPVPTRKPGMLPACSLSSFSSSDPMSQSYSQRCNRPHAAAFLPLLPTSSEGFHRLSPSNLSLPHLLLFPSPYSNSVLNHRTLLPRKQVSLLFFSSSLLLSLNPSLIPNTIAGPTEWSFCTASTIPRRQNKHILIECSLLLCPADVLRSLSYPIFLNAGSQCIQTDLT